MRVSMKYLYVESVAIVIFGLKSGGGGLDGDGVPRSFRFLFAVSFSPRSLAPSSGARGERVGVGSRGIPRSPIAVAPQLVKYWYVYTVIYNRRALESSKVGHTVPHRLGFERPDLLLTFLSASQRSRDFMVHTEEISRRSFVARNRRHRPRYKSTKCVTRPKLERDRHSAL